MLTDLRLALRSLRRAPAYTIVAVLVLALGIGATTAMFAVVDRVVLRPLGYDDAGRLVALSSSDSTGASRTPPSFLDVMDWRARARSLDGVAFVRGATPLLRGPEGAERLLTAYVSEGFFRVLGARALHGRVFLAEEERSGATPTIVLAHGFWQSRFGGDPGVVGRVVDVGGGGATIVGVLPPTVDFPVWAQAYAPIAALPSDERAALERRDFRVDNAAIGRLAPGVTLARARAELDAIAAQLAAEHPSSNAGIAIAAVPLRDDLVGSAGSRLGVLLAAVSLVLLVACVDVANLSLVRATSRAREVAIRTALGAGRWRIARPLLAESTLVAAAGGVLGLVLALWCVGLVRALAPAGIPRLDELALDWRAAAAGTLLSAACAVVFGLVAARYASPARLAIALREGSARAGRGAAGQRLRAGFVVAQIALAIVLVVGATLLVGSFVRLARVHPGFESESLLVLRVEPDAARHGSAERLLALYDHVDAEVSSVPGVRSAAFVNHFPMTGTAVVTPVSVAGRTAQPRDFALYRLASADYFGTAGQRVVAGRGLVEADMRATAGVAVVNETFVTQYLGGDEPVGARVTVRKQAVGRDDYDAPVTATIVGVVEDTRLRALSRPAVPEVFLPLPVNPWRSAFLVVRAERDAAALAAPVRRAVQRVDADIPVAALRPASELVSGSLRQARLDAALLGAFAATALLLASLGLYGVVAHGVAQRSREIGVRAALGARPTDVARLFLAEALRLALLGVALGTLLALGATRALGSLVFGVSVTDPATYAGVALSLTVVALLASWLPARRAARVDPAAALRSE